MITPKQALLALSLIGSLFIVSCGDTSGSSVIIDGTTKFTSSTLASASPSGASVQAASGAATITSGGDLTITPTNVTGEAMALLYGFGTGQGLDIFGPLRPDLAQPGVDLVSFDMSAQLSIASSVSLKDDFPGGTSEILVLSFGYMDVHFTLSGTNLTNTQHVMRVAMGSVEGMTRGDVLMKLNGVFNWYDLDNHAFTPTRPDNPVVITEVRDFVDSTAPQRHFYSFNVGLTNGGITVDVNELKSSAGILNTVDFSMGNLITLDQATDANALHDDDLIQKFSLDSIFVEGVGDGLTASSTIQVL